MRKLLSLFLLISAIALPVAAQTGPWELEDDSVVRFMCAGPTITNPARGRFSAVNARLTMDPSNLATARGRVEVLLASITTELGGWDAMFRAAPFLALDEFPRSTFELLEVRGASALRPNVWTRLRLFGRMTVKETSHEIEVRARARYTPAGDGEPARVEVLATLPIDWDQYDIAVPEGWTRNFAGDQARVRMRLLFRKQ